MTGYREVMREYASMGQSPRNSFASRALKNYSSSEDEKPKYFASVWIEGPKAAAIKFASKDDNIVPLTEWQSHTNAMDFSLSKVIEKWNSETELSKVLVPAVANTEEANHPMQRLIKSAPIRVVPAIVVFEGLAAYQESTEAKHLDWSHCKLKGKIEELIRRSENSPSPLLMAFLQGLVHKDKSRQGLCWGTIPNPDRPDFTSYLM